MPCRRIHLTWDPGDPYTRRWGGISWRPWSSLDHVLMDDFCWRERSCSQRTHVFLLHRSTCLLVPQEHMSSCAARNVVLRHKKACPLAPQADMLSCATRRHFCLCHKKTYLLVAQEDMSSCGTRGCTPAIGTTCHLSSLIGTNSH